MFHELEYKYKADDIGLKEFKELMSRSTIKKSLEVSSWDVYYTKGDEEFLRFRNGTMPELTKKTKTQSGNNWVRVECDLPLDPRRVTEAIVDKFAEMEGYTKSFKIFKSCFIYWVELVSYVFYIVYDENMKEKGRFIEVEFEKDQVANHTNPEEILNMYAKKLEDIDLTPQNRMKKSLFEMFRKKNVEHSQT